MSSRSEGVTRTKKNTVASIHGRDPGQDLGFLLGDVTRLLKRAFDRRVQGLGLTRVQWQALAYLARTEALTQTELAAQLEVSRAAAGNLISRLTRAGFVTRERDKEDQRMWRVRLTARFNQVSEQLVLKAEELYREVLAELSPAEVSSLKSSLQTIRARLSRSLENDSEPASQ